MRRTLLLVIAFPLLLAVTMPGTPEPVSSMVSAVGAADGPTAPHAPAQRSVILSAPPVGEGDALDGPARPVDPASSGPEVGPPADDALAPGAAARPDPMTSTTTGTTDLLMAAAAPAAGRGPLVRYSLQVDPTLGFPLDEVAATVSAALLDERSWARSYTIERVADPVAAGIRIVIAAPALVDALCATAGLDTAGIFSCWNGRVAALNGWRWAVGARDFDDVETYRTYLVNHEFGHGLGHGHVGCPAAGELAPVMMQQSKSVAPCLANGWPFPG